MLFAPSGALFECYKRGCWGFSRCCGEEHDAFWQCYTTKRVRADQPTCVFNLSTGTLALRRAPAQGVNKTVIGHHVETWAEKWGIPFKIPDRVKRNQDKAPND